MIILFSPFITADSAAARRAFHVKVWSEQRMSFLAMSPVADRKIHAAHRVHLRRGDFKMSRIHALFVSAKMVALKVLSDWAKEKFPGEAVSVFLTTVRDSIASVSSAVTSGCPNPATRTTPNRNLFSKTLRQSVKVNRQHTALRIAEMPFWGLFFLP